MCHSKLFACLLLAGTLTQASHISAAPLRVLFAPKLNHTRSPSLRFDKLVRLRIIRYVTKLRSPARSTRAAGTKPERDFHAALEQWGINDPKSAERLRRLASSARPSDLDRSLRTLGIELFRSLGASTRLFEVIADHHLQAAGLSAPRFRLLVWLHVEEMRGNTQGLSPSRLSHFQHVTKNTVSSLLASLEEQGLIERAMSRTDKRQFNIRLSTAGRELIGSILPKHSTFMAETLSGLTLQDQAALVALLHKLQLLLLDRASHEGIDHRKPKGV